MQQARLDLITENASANVRRVQARDLGASVVQSLFRLTKQAMVHSMDNQAVVRQVEDAVRVLNDYAERTDTNISILFSYGSIFVGGQLLKANRQTYDGATELGDFLKKFGYSELAIQKGVTAQDLFSFVSAITDANRNGRAQALEKPSPRVRMRAVGEAALKRGATVERLDENQAVVRAYASAIVIMRRFFEQLKKGRYDLPQRVKRIAQSLVDLSAGETPAFLGVTAARNANHDEAGKAVNATILAVSVARQINDDIVGLVRLAMAALLYDIAKPRLTGTVGPNPPLIMPRLSDAQEREVPAASAAVLTALGRVNEPSVMRTVIAYEAHWHTRIRELGPLYRGMRPATLQARIIGLTRRFNDLLTPAPGADPLPADDAILQLESEAVDQVDHTVIRLLVGALGIFPTGTLLQIGTGEMGLVVSTPAHPSQYSLPRMRLHYDANGGQLPQPIDVDLATLPAGDPRKQVVRVVAPADENSRHQARIARQGNQPAPAQPAQHQQPGFGAQPGFGQPQAQQPVAQIVRPPGFTPQHTPTNVESYPSSPSNTSNPFTPTGSNPQAARPPARTPPPDQLRAQNRTPPPQQQQHVRQPTPAPLQPGEPGWDEQSAYEAEQRA